MAPLPVPVRTAKIIITRGRDILLEIATCAPIAVNAPNPIVSEINRILFKMNYFFIKDYGQSSRNNTNYYIYRIGKALGRFLLIKI